MISKILALRETSSTNDKVSMLKSWSEDELLQRLLKMTYDKVVFTYGITMKNIKYKPEGGRKMSDHFTLGMALDFLETQLATRSITGNDALTLTQKLLQRLKKEDAQIIELVLGRDLKCGIGRTFINKVWKNLIIKPNYMRCGVYSEKTSKKIKFPAIIQLKADGLYKSVTVVGGECTFTSRSGEEQDFPHLSKQMKHYPDGVYVGELLVDGEADRALANGIINSHDDEAKEKVFIQLWDFITLDEYSRGKDKKNKTAYRDRFAQLMINIKTTNSKVRLIPWVEVTNIKEALSQTSKWMTEGYEGAILKDYNNIFVDHTSPTQLKLKLVIELEVRCTGFTEGTKGTSREHTFGAMTYSNDEGTIQGAVSGFSDLELEEYNNSRDKFIGKVFSLECNDLTKGGGHDYYALSHPRFSEFRTDKDDTDTLERAFELRKSAMELS